MTRPKPKKPKRPYRSVHDYRNVAAGKAKLAEMIADSARRDAAKEK